MSTAFRKYDRSLTRRKHRPFGKTASPVRLFSADACRNRFLIVLGQSADVAEASAEIVEQADQWDFDSLLALDLMGNDGALMRVLEQDGSVSTMCGNGARAAGRLLDVLDLNPNVMLEDGSTLEVRKTLDGLYSVPMGQVVRGGDFVPTTVGDWPRFQLYRATGEPHAVVHVPSVHEVDLEAWGWATVPHANCTIVSRDAAGQVFARTFERGVNRETNSCGTGATSAAQLLLDLDAERYGVSDREQVVNVRMPGGLLRIRHVPGQGSFLEGPAEVWEEARHSWLAAA